MTSCWWCEGTAEIPATQSPTKAPNILTPQPTYMDGYYHVDIFYGDDTTNYTGHGAESYCLGKIT